MAATSTAPAAGQEVRQTSFAGKTSTCNGSVSDSRSHESGNGQQENQQVEEEDSRPQRRHVLLQRHPEAGFGFVAGSDKPVVVRFVKEGETIVFDFMSPSAHSPVFFPDCKFFFPLILAVSILSV